MVALLGSVAVLFVVLFLVLGKLLATLEIAFPPLSKPSWFNVTVLPLAPVASAGFVIVMPVGVIFTVLLLSSLNSALVNPLNAGFRE